MAKSALFVGWGAMIPGRERLAQQVLGEGMALLGQLQETGVIDSFETYLLEPHGGDLLGFVILKGDAEKIAALRSIEAIARLLVRVQLVHENVRMVGAYAGEEAGRMFGIWAAEEEGLGV